MSVELTHAPSTEQVHGEELVTTALGRFGVMPPYDEPLDEQQTAALELANEFRQRQCALQQERHERSINLRNDLFPTILALSITYHSIRARIVEIEKAINKHHSDVRDRNAVTEEQRATLVSLRAERDATLKAISAARQPWKQLFKDFSEWWANIPDPERPECCWRINWKSVKTLAVRRQLYAGVALPDGPIGRYAALWIELDLRERELEQEYAGRIHSSTRAAIKEASVIKLTRTAPGMRYCYGQAPEPTKWRQLCLNFDGGGLSLADALAGRSRQLRLTRLYSNNKASGEETLYEVEQQIGTSANPHVLTYRMKWHREYPMSVKIRQWYLNVLPDGTRYVVPTCSGVPFRTSRGSDSFTYELLWYPVPGGIEVGRFVGASVCESLVLPHWLVGRIFRVDVLQAEFDNRANAFLKSRGVVPQPQADGKKPRQGVKALEVYLDANPQDAGATNLLYSFDKPLYLAREDAARASRCIEKIYETVANRVCALHAQVLHDDLDLAHEARYRTRDLLRPDLSSDESKRRRQAVAPGKLRECIEKRGLTAAASGWVPVSLPADARNTDIFTSYVQSLGVATGRKQSQPRYRS